jgi:hypothetical protein
MSVGKPVRNPLNQLAFCYFIIITSESLRNPNTEAPYVVPKRRKLTATFQEHNCRRRRLCRPSWYFHCPVGGICKPV